MSDLVKSVLGGGWTLVVGWILPSFLTLQLLSLLLGPLSWFPPAARALEVPPSTRQVALLAGAAVLGLVLAAAATPLYRLLEGHVLWPSRLAERAKDRHRERCRVLANKFEREMVSGDGVRAGLAAEAAGRYPPDSSEFAPTRLGNAIRRLETYAVDRYRMDSQLLWGHLAAVAPERLVKEVDNARTSVDLFVCLVYGGSAVAVLSAVALIGGGLDGLAVVTGVTGALLGVLCYRLAVRATDAWNTTVRAMVDLGRCDVAKAFGLAVPEDIEQERLMWQAVNTFVRYPYPVSSKDYGATDILNRFRAAAAGGGSRGPAATPPPVSDDSSATVGTGSDSPPPADGQRLPSKPGSGNVGPGDAAPGDAGTRTRGRRAAGGQGDQTT